MAEWKAQLQAVWQKLSKTQRYAIMGGALAVFIAILGWSYWLGGKAEYQPLYTNLETKDAGEIVNKLKEQKVDNKISDNGSTILVPAKDVYALRLSLAAQGLPRGKKGFEVFDQTKFGTTEFQNKMNYLQAMQGEMARTIEELKEVESARVHIVMPEDSLYKKNEKPATASIMLKLKPDAELDKNQVKGIVNLVAHSVQGLKPENITVVDNFAKVLNVYDEEEQKNQDSKNNKAFALDKFLMTKKIQDQLQYNVQSLLDQSLGQNRAAARVTVELDFDKRLIDKQVFAPVVEEKGILRSSQDITENYQGTGKPPAGGPAGTTSNIPGYPAATNQQTQSNYEKKDSTKNYEINETKEKIVVDPGAIKRITVAVFIDETLTQAQQEGITRVVASASGINLNRGDQVSVERIPFNTDLVEQKKVEQAKAEQEKYIYYGLAALGLLIVAVAMVIWYLRKKSAEERERILQEQSFAERMEKERLATERMIAEKKMLADYEKERAAMIRSAEGKGSDDGMDSFTGEELSEEEKFFKEQQVLVESFAKENPEEFAQLLQAWLSEE